MKTIKTGNIGTYSTEKVEIQSTTLSLNMLTTLINIELNIFK